jgi:hypothetical protein
MGGCKPQFEFYPLLLRHQIPFVVIGGHAIATTTKVPERGNLQVRR